MPARQDCTAVTDDDLRARARRWLHRDPDPETRAEIESLLSSPDGRLLRERFGTTLRFGTAGLRAPMGAGPNRMNRVVVRRATAGLMSHLGPDATVVIGHDARRNSAVFALDAARVVAAAGGRALLLPPLVPTPVLAFAVRHLGADAGVMCTASHNPPEDNGYKLYLGDGAQVVPPVDDEIAAAIGSRDTEAVEVAAEDDPRIERLGDEVLAAYVEHAAGLVGRDGPRDLTVVYSPLHGVGAALTERVFAAAGFEPLLGVAAQARPDGRFPTVSHPNPEEPEALALAVREAQRCGADLALVHDPDADRLGAVAPRDGEWCPLSGNEIGALLADHVLRNGEGRDRLVVDTVVSSSLLHGLADEYGVAHERTLTGFKWIVRAGSARPGLRFVFGYEEALGFSVDDYVRDKDGITAALMLADLAAELRARGATLWDHLDDIAHRHGLHETQTWSIRLGADAPRTPGHLLGRLFDDPPHRLGRIPVEEIIDHRVSATLPPSELVELRLGQGARLCVRPSGTEPRVKLYAEVVHGVEPGVDGVERARQEAGLVFEEIRAAAIPLVESVTGGKR
jgi:phosphomannomutase